MIIESVQVQNFRCIRDSGEIPLTPDLTIFIGENESGKTSLLDALVCFNLGQELQDADLSTMSPARGNVLSGIMSKDSFDTVTITIKLTTGERERLNIPQSVLPGDTLRITKRLDNSYVIKGANNAPLSELYANVRNSRLLTEINGIRRQIGSVYQGTIVRKLPQDEFVFLRRSAGDPESADLILFRSEAGALWEELHQGDLVQVTHQAPDPYGRNARAMNVGEHFNMEEELNAVENAASLETHEFTDALENLLERIVSIPRYHPLRSIFSNDFQNLLKEHIEDSRDEIPWDDRQILGEIPTFERGFVSAVNDKLPISASYDAVPEGETDRGLLALIDEVELSPSDAVKAEHTERVRIFDEKSQLLSKIFTDAWVRDVQAEFVPFNQDRELGLAITSQGSLDPPSRRSQGFNSYLGLTARLLDLRRRSENRLVLILDDPAMHLHPAAQEKLAEVLGEQAFQVLVATHFPFMMSSDRLDRVRLLCRTESGAYFENDWQHAGDGLLPIRGALSKWTLGKIPVLVEGQTDRYILKDLQNLLKGEDQNSIYSVLEPLPSGGSAMPETAKALRAMNVKFIALVDGDRQGDDIKRRLMREVELAESAIVSLRDVIDGVTAPTIEDLFSQTIQKNKIWTDGGLMGVLGQIKEKRMELDNDSEYNLEMLYVMLNKALNAELASQ